MAKTTYQTICCGDYFAVRADWAQASDPIQVAYEPGEWQVHPAGLQVADCHHDGMEALRGVMEMNLALDPDADSEEVALALERAQEV